MAVTSRDDETCIVVFCKLSFRVIFTIAPRTAKPINPPRNLKYIVDDVTTPKSLFVTAF